MLNKKEADLIANSITNKLIVYGHLELNLKNIWKEEILIWLSENQNYNLFTHAKLNCMYLDTTDGIQLLFQEMKNCMAENKPALPEKQKTFSQLFAEETYAGKIQDIKDWLRYCKKPLPCIAIDWARQQPEEIKQEIRNEKQRSPRKII